MGGAMTARVSQTILVADDEPSLLKLIKGLLQRRGFRVFAAHTGQAAIEIAQRHTGSIDLLVADVSLPRMSGAELGEHLQALCPRLRVMLISGSDRDCVAHDKRWTFLTKPFVPSDLIAKVRATLADATLPVPASRRRAPLKQGAAGSSGSATSQAG
jgi:DNA-binding response OmpR family regulator